MTLGVTWGTLGPHSRDKRSNCAPHTKKYSGMGTAVNRTPALCPHFQNQPTEQASGLTEKCGDPPIQCWVWRFSFSLLLPFCHVVTVLSPYPSGSSPQLYRIVWKVKNNTQPFSYASGFKNHCCILI